MDLVTREFRQRARERLVELVEEAKDTVKTCKRELKRFDSNPTETAIMIGFESSYPPEGLGCDVDWEIFAEVKRIFFELSEEGRQEVLDSARRAAFEESEKTLLA